MAAEEETALKEVDDVEVEVEVEVRMSTSLWMVRASDPGLCIDWASGYDWLRETNDCGWSNKGNCGIVDESLLSATGPVDCATVLVLVLMLLAELSPVITTWLAVVVVVVLVLAEERGNREASL